MSTVDDVSWIEKLTENVSSKVKEICRVWTAIGIDGSRLQARKETLQSYLFSMLDEMYDEELAAQQTLMKSIKELETKISELETELGFSAVPIGDSLTLVLTEKALFDRFKSLEERAVSITESFNSLRKEEELLATRLGESTAVILFRHVPNQQQMRSLKANIDYLTMEKLRQDIIKIRAALETDSYLDIDLLSRITQDDALDVLPLSTEFLAQVEELRHKCDSRLSEIEAECLNLSDEILSLAARLNLDREELLNLDQPVSASFLSQLKNEASRLAELRRQNLSIFIENCRNELHDWWDACYLSENERNMITMEPGEYTEAVLSSLESEINHWKAFHAVHQSVFEAIKEWQTVFARFRETEMKKKDPVVLKNRGGILLKVEKEFKQLQRDLKRLETEVHRLSTDPDHSHLCVHGMPVMEFLEASKRQYDEDKENEVKQKKEIQKK
ncbi:unnamed protein product [Echinostoma caproni]|uniref:Zgc: n=1 Tax=Echinostoma caproni TaxID=27848 RepID=A0A183B384_9TREM|nr:unnamed protein product [Echinostoma caproni]